MFGAIKGGAGSVSGAARRNISSVPRIAVMAAAAFALGWPAGSLGSGQDPGDVSGWVDSDESRRGRIAGVVGEVFVGTEIRENLRVLCDEIGGRVAGTDAGREARSFVERLFNRYGLVNVHQEPFEMFGWERGAFHCEIRAPRHVDVHAVALANTPSTKLDGTEGGVVDVGHGSVAELERLGDAVKGKFALAVAEAMPDGGCMHCMEMMAVLAERGAMGLLYQTQWPGNLPVTGMCWMEGNAPVPGVGISKEDGDWIRRQLERGEEVRIKLRMTNLSGHAESANVVGEITGRGREFVLVGAHLDAWDLGQGALDNGTGAVVIIEAARVLASLGVQPESSIRFVLFMGNEPGLCGSRAYAATHGRELSNCRAMISCEIVGNPLGLRIMGHREADPFFEEFLQALNGFELTSGISHDADICGDHQPFLLSGIPVVTPVSRIENDYVKYIHTSSDTFDKITFRQLNLEAALVAALALELASTPDRVMNRLDGEGVRRILEENGLEEALRLLQRLNVYGSKL